MSLLLGACVNGEIDQTVRVAPLIVIPRDHFVEVVVEEDAGSGVDDRAPRVMHKVL